MLNQFSPDEGQGLSAAEQAQAGREQWILSQWEKMGGELLFSIRTLLFSSAAKADIEESNRDALTGLRDELLHLVQQGSSIRGALFECEITALDVTLRREYLEAIANVTEQVLTVIESSGIKAIKDQSQRLADRLKMFTPAGREQFEVVDVIAAAVQFFPREVSWEQPPSELDLATRCRPVELQYVLSEISDSVEEAIQAIALAGIQEVFRNSLEESEAFRQAFDANRSRYHDLMVYRPDLAATMTAPDTVALSVEVSSETLSEWIDSIPLLNKRLENAQHVAMQNGCYLTVNLQEYPSSLTVSLTVSTPETDSFHTDRPHTPLRLMHQAATDTVTFPITVRSEVAGESVSLPVTTQRTALMSADAMISLRNTLEAAGDFVTLSTRPWEGIVCAANCSVTLNEDSFREAFFECTLVGSERGGLPLNDALREWYTFPWEEESSDSEVAFYLRYNSREMPGCDSLMLPANAFMDQEIRMTLLQLFDKFQAVHFDAGVQSDLATLYSPEERVEVIKALVRALAEQYVDSMKAHGQSDRVLWCAGTYLDFHSNCELKRDLFQVEVYDSAKGLVECGAFSSTTFELSMRPHSQQLEEEALTRFQRALDSFKENGDLKDSLQACGLLIEQGQLEILQEPFQKTGLAAMEADPVRTLVSLCRDPWNRLELADGHLQITDAGHPPAPSQSVSYGAVSYIGADSRPVTIFRQALMLYTTEQAGKNNGYTFTPSEAFFERAAGSNQLPLDC